MLKLDVLAAELNLWANETEQIYRATKEIKYRRDVTHLRYLAATLNQSTDDSVPTNRTLTINGITYDLSANRTWNITLDQVTTAGNITLNNISVGAINANLSNITTSNIVYYNSSTGLLTYGQGSGLSPGLYAQTSDSIPITNTIVENTLIDGGVGTLSIPANGFQVGASFIAYFSGKISCVNNEKIEIHCLTSSIILADTGLITLAAATNKNWELYINFTIRSIGTAGVAAIATSGRFAYNKDSNNAPESVGFYNLNNTTFNTTIPNVLNVTGKWNSANPLNSIYTDIFNLYRIF
jgi:hypothetical protein